MDGREPVNANTLSISVSIADRAYKLTINSSEEGFVREAAKGIQAKIKTFAETYAYRDKQDLLAMVALQYATDQIITINRVESEQKLTQTRITDINLLLEKAITEEPTQEVL